jgi:PAS domain-containing protein
MLCLDDGTQIVAHNSAWGRDFGDEWEHLSLNVSPEIVDIDFEFVSAREIAEAVDTASGEVLYRRPDGTN